jgi:N-formylmaleamate deformylase
MRVFVPTWTDAQVALRAEWLHTCQLDAIRTTYDGFHTDDIHADLPHLDVPARLIVAGAAPVIQDADVAEITALAPRMEVRTVEGAGHMIPFDDLDAFVAAVLD